MVILLELFSGTGSVGHVFRNRGWELEGSRKGPLDRGVLGEEEDVLSERAIQMGIGRVIELERESGGADLRFSCIALARKVEN